MRSLALCFLAACQLTGADLTGIWLGQLKVRNGEFQDVSFQFSQTGSVLKGKMYGDYDTTPLSGTVAGDLVTFIVNVQEQAGNQINDTRLRFTGKVKDDELELFRDREASTNAGNGGSVQIKNNAKQVVTLKRLLRDGPAH